MKACGPLGRRRNPAASSLLDSLEAEHRRISPAAAALASAAQRYAATSADELRAELAAVLDALEAALFPHLDREVEEAMPVVSASITQAEWHAVEQEYNIKPKSLAQLGMEGHWLLDGIDAEGYQVVVGTVPAVPRGPLVQAPEGETSVIPNGGMVSPAREACSGGAAEG